MVEVELNNVYINIGANNDSEKLWTKNTANSGKPIKAVYASYVYVYRIEPYNYQLNCELMNYDTAYLHV